MHSLHAGEAAVKTGRPQRLTPLRRSMSVLPPTFKLTMDQPCATDRTNKKMLTFGLFNDVYFSHWAPPALCDSTWAPFPRLPTELRLYIWLLCLRHRRMIEKNICAADDEDHTAYPGHVSKPRYYTGRNPRSKIVSGRGYTLRVRGPGSYAASFSPLFWVNKEARRAARSFYHVHLPFPGPGAEQVLHLNPGHDVVHVRPRGSRAIPGNLVLPPMTILADFLHDVKAYDCKDQGCVLWWWLRVVVDRG